MKGEWCYFKSYFSKEYCNSLIEKTKSLDFSPGNMGISGEMIDSNLRKVMCLNLDDIYFDQFYSELWDLQVVANNQWFNFAIDEIEVVQLLQYSGKNLSKYESHKDTFWVTKNQKHRKLTAIVQLSDPNSYEGGDFTLYDCGEYPLPEEIREQGTVIIFPSMIYHKVSEVTSGTRHSAVSWFLGPYFR